MKQARVCWKLSNWRIISFWVQKKRRLSSFISRAQTAPKCCGVCSVIFWWEKFDDNGFWGTSFDIRSVLYSRYRYMLKSMACTSGIFAVSVTLLNYIATCSYPLSRITLTWCCTPSIWLKWWGAMATFIAHPVSCVTELRTHQRWLCSCYRKVLYTSIIERSGRGEENFETVETITRTSGGKLKYVCDRLRSIKSSDKCIIFVQKKLTAKSLYKIIKVIHYYLASIRSQNLKLVRVILFFS